MTSRAPACSCSCSCSSTSNINLASRDKVVNPFDSDSLFAATSHLRSTSSSSSASSFASETDYKVNRNSIGQALVASCYPTPPPSPELEDSLSTLLPDTAPLIEPPNIATVPLDDLEDFDEYDDNEEIVDFDEEYDEDYSIEDDSPKVDPAIHHAQSHSFSVQIPIPILLDTHHDIPQAATFRLRSPASLLALTGGKRILTLDSEQTLWDRMPYSAAAAAIHARHTTEEDVVEQLVGGDKPEKKPNSLQWAMRSKSNERMSSIFVHPPTPERDNVPASLDAAVGSSSALPESPAPSAPRESPPIVVSSTTASTLPGARLPSPSIAANRAMPVPLQVLPEVRSPPRRTIAMAADSLQITQKRGRRPKLFGFTELPDSGSSASSSVANSRSNSPERPAAPAISSAAAPPGPSSHFIPRRQPIRARSDTNLPTVASLSAATAPQQPPRRRENGLKLDFTGIIPVASPADAQSSVIPSPYSAKLIRKKSGEILKPALKYGGPLAANGTPLEGPRTDLSPDSPHSARFESKSCPTTPSCPKYVHFDTQLERVKLFLHDQKPQVVSRGGSPSEHYTTSEGEEYPFPPTDEERDEKKVLQIKLPNFPTSHAPDSDLYLESLFLDDDRKNLRGMILCKNFAYNKWVAVRFTFDFWQTTSEVTATYKDAVRGGGYDRFSFVIKLQDILSRIEEKTMFLAIRYNTDGREIWDSNGGQNYQVLFEKVSTSQPVTVPKRSSVSIQPGMGQAVGGRTSQWSVTGGNADDRLADLRAKLSRLTADDASLSPPQLSPNRERTFAFNNKRGGRISSPSGSPARSFSSIDARTSDLPSAGGALAARYDFGTALKTTRKLSPNSAKVPLPEVQTGLLNYGKANNGHAATEFYSPRYSPNRLPEPTMESVFAQGVFSDSPATITTAQAPASLPVPDVTVQTPSPPAVESQPVTIPASATKSPVTRPGIARSISTPAQNISSPRDSPPSLDMSGSVTDTPSESPKSPPDMSFAKWSPAINGDSKSDMTMASYSSFIEQFCWGGAANSSPFDHTRRTHSASSLDQYFAEARNSGSTTPRPVSYPANRQTKMSNGSSTPSSTSSYYTATPTGREDLVASVEDGLGLELERGSPRFVGVRMDGMNMGRMSPPVAC